MGFVFPQETNYMTAPPWRKTKEWKAIAQDSKDIFCVAAEKLNEEYSEYISAFSLATKLDQPFSQIRHDEFIRSCTDDLYRYATYHPVKKRGLYYIQESVRASYMTKWLMMLKPFLLDSYIPLTSVENIKKYIPQDQVGRAFDFYRRCNEFFAIYCASVALRVKMEKTKSGEDPVYLLLTEFFDIDIERKKTKDDREYKDFLYTLRYRMPTQDVYRPIYRRIETMSIHDEPN